MPHHRRRDFVQLEQVALRARLRAREAVGANGDHGARITTLETADTAKSSQISSLENDWAKLAVNFSGTPAFNATIGSGDVYTYTYTNPSRTLYRLVGASSEAFYTGFDGSAVSGLVATRG